MMQSENAVIAENNDTGPVMLFTTAEGYHHTFCYRVHLDTRIQFQHILVLGLLRACLR